MKIKFMHGFMVIVLLLVQLANLSGLRVNAEATPDQVEQTITSSNALDVKVKGTVQGDNIIWALSYTKKDQGEDRALKVRVATDKAGLYRLSPRANQLVQGLQAQDNQPANQWFIEKQYGRYAQGVLYYTTPKTSNRIYVSTELNRREAAPTAAATTVAATEEAATEDADAAAATATPVDSVLANSAVGPVEVLLTLTQATEEEQAVAIERPGANTPQTDADAANTVPAVTEQVEAVQGALLSNAFYANTAARSTEARYTGSIPLAYNNDTSGIYPKSGWAVSGNTNVINHIGGRTQGSQLYSNQGVNSANHAYTWLNYGDNANDPEFSLRKYAKETTTPGLFDVELNVKGNTVKEYDPMAIVLVLDYSGSMTTAKAKAMRDGVSNFLDKIEEEGLGDVVSVGVVGYSSPNDKTYINFSVPIRTITNNSDNIKSAIKAVPKGATFTQKAISDGAAMLAGSNIADKRMILLTDGVPTYSYKVKTAERLNDADRTIVGTTFESTFDNPGSTAELDDDYTVNRLTIKDTWAATIGQARLVKSAGVTLEALGIILGADGSYMDKDKVEAQMKKIPSLDAQSKPLYQAADTASDVTAYLVAQAEQVIDSYNTISKGSISDPLGAQFNYATGSNGQVTQPVVTTTGNAAKPTATIANGKLTVSDLTLGKDETVTIKYQVRINTEAQGFVAGKWYQINGATTLTPQPGQTAVNFGIPSAKAPAKTYTIKKVWDQISSDQAKPAELKVTAQRKDSVYANRQTVTLTANNNWTATFQDVAYGNQGQALTYDYVSEEADDFDLGAYLSSANYANATLTLTNLQYGVGVVKKSTDGSDIASGTARFALKTYTNGNYTTTSTQTEMSQAGLLGLKAGYYSLTETVAPDGFLLDATEYLFQRDAAGKWFYRGYKQNGVITARNQAITGTLNLNVVADGKSDQFSVNAKGNILTLTKYNEPNRTMQLVLIKKDTLGNLLPGAKFELTAPEGKETLTSTSNAGGVEAATVLEAGKVYTLKETEAPGGYDQLAGTLQFTVNAQGTGVSVTLDGVSLPHQATLNGYAYSLHDGVITVTAVNELAESIMPVTGGSGTALFTAMAVTLMLGAAGISLATRTKKEQEGR